MTFSESERRAPNLPFTRRGDDSRNNAQSAVIESQPAWPDLVYLPHHDHFRTDISEFGLFSEQSSSQSEIRDIRKEPNTANGLPVSTLLDINFGTSQDYYTEIGWVPLSSSVVNSVNGTK
ncbi:hypothetical protein FOZG_11189 [Fusarium oxysporum Fo47]|uniref:Uncharacterized protein n=1 Tax=Fusarium oxysporum Fo47 TaxID=660027 RepID=W9JZD1_FUSOX|nr:hypothetical protein FOZG_11189 [Fusarium oxysporum Fo47]